MRNLTLPSTRIEGYFFPEWDIELYRDQSLLAFQETDTEGYYFFDNVPLFSERNSFRIVAYGPQGEVREETISIPYDRQRVSEQGGVYDVSLTFQDRQFYRKIDSRDEDRNTPHLVGFYEAPIGNNSAVRLGGRYRQEDSEDKAYASAAISTAYQQALINAEIASDEQGELASRLSATRQFGKHRARVDLDLATDEFSPGQQSTAVQTLSNRYNFEGPLGLKIGDHPRYSANIQYSENSLDETNLNGFMNLNTQFGRIGLIKTSITTNPVQQSTGPILAEQQPSPGLIVKIFYGLLDAIASSQNRHLIVSQPFGNTHSVTSWNHSCRSIEQSKTA